MTTKHQPEIQFDVAALDKLDHAQLSALVSKVLEDPKHASSLRSMMKSLVRSAAKSPAKSAGK